MRVDILDVSLVDGRSKYRQMELFGERLPEHFASAKKSARGTRRGSRPRARACHAWTSAPPGETPAQMRLPLSPSVDVLEFHRAFGARIAPSLQQDLQSDLTALRVRLIQEEVAELTDAVANSDIVSVADALGDIVYVTFGAAIALGVDLDAVVQEIHRSNMTKLGLDGMPILRSDGKVLKGPLYEPPRLSMVLGLTGALEPSER